MKGQQKKFFCSLLAAISTIVMISGCASEPESRGNNHAGSGSRKIITYQEMLEEYKTSVSKLQWPEGYKPPIELKGEDSSLQYQSGYGDTKASQAYECVWEKEWLNTYSTNKARAEKAIAALEKVPSMGYMSVERADDATRRFFKDYLDRAKLGDPSGFQENVTANCPN